MTESKNLRLFIILGVLLLAAIISGVYLAHFRDLKRAGYDPTFLGSAFSLLDSVFFDSPSNDSNGGFDPFYPSGNGVVTINTSAITKISEGLFSGSPATLYQGARYNLRVTLGDNMKPAILKNYYVNFVKDGVVYTMDARTEMSVLDGVFSTRILNVAGRPNGTLDVLPGQYDGYVNVVWDTGTQTIKFKVMVLPERIVVQPTSILITETPAPQPQPAPTQAPVPTPAPLPTSASALSILRLDIQDFYGVNYGLIQNTQYSLWAYAQISTNANEFVYSITFSSYDGTGSQYNLSSGIATGNGIRELRVPLPRVDTLSNGKYKVIISAAPRLANGSNGAFSSREATIVIQIPSAQPPVVVVPPVVTPSGNDGNVTFPGGTVNLNTGNYISGRSCSDGGDAVNYSVLALSSNTATLSKTPSSGCLLAGDEVLIINLQGTPSSIANVGNYELLRVQSISGPTITFTIAKKKLYGDMGGDGNIGFNVNNQRVMLQRVPNYTNATINSGTTLIASPWNGTNGGVLAFRANGTLNNYGRISMDASGYWGGTTPGMQGEARTGKGSTISHCYNLNYYGNGTANNDMGGGAHHCYGSGAGGGNATPGANGYGNAIAGIAVSVSNSNSLLLGGGGGAAAGAAAGHGGGIILILANSINGTAGFITSNGASAPGPCGVGTYTYGGGGGAGGSIYIVSTNLNVGSSVKTDPGAGLGCAYSGGNGGSGRVEFGSNL